MTTEVIFLRTSVFLSAKWGFKWTGLVTSEVPSSTSNYRTLSVSANVRSQLLSWEKTLYSVVSGAMLCHLAAEMSS